MAHSPLQPPPQLHDPTPHEVHESELHEPGPHELTQPSFFEEGSTLRSTA